MMGNSRGEREGKGNAEIMLIILHGLNFVTHDYAADFSLSISLFMPRHSVRGLRGRGAFFET